MKNFSYAYQILLSLPLSWVAGIGLSTPLLAQPAESDALVRRIRQEVSRGNAGRGVHDMVEELINLGSSAIPSIAQAFSDTSFLVRARFAGLLSRIISPEAQLLQLKVALSDTNSYVANIAAAGLGERQLPRELTSEECAMVLKRLEHREGTVGTAWGDLGGRAPKVPALQRPLVSALLRNLVEDSIGKRNLRSVPVHGGYLTYEASILLGYASAFSRYIQEVVRSETANLLSQSADKSTRRWILVCLGYGGDHSVLDELEQVVNDTAEDSSIRALALRAYAKTAKREAMQLLEKHEHDTSPGPDPRHGPLEVVAHDELFRLRRR